MDPGRPLPRSPDQQQSPSPYLPMPLSPLVPSPSMFGRPSPQDPLIMEQDLRRLVAEFGCGSSPLERAPPTSSHPRSLPPQTPFLWLPSPHPDPHVGSLTSSFFPQAVPVRVGGQGESRCVAPIQIGVVGEEFGFGLVDFPIYYIDLPI